MWSNHRVVARERHLIQQKLKSSRIVHIYTRMVFSRTPVGVGLRIIQPVSGVIYARSSLRNHAASLTAGCRRCLAVGVSSPVPLPKAPAGSRVLLHEETALVAPLTCKLVRGGAKGLALTCTPIPTEESDAPDRTWEDTWMEMKFPVSSNPSFANQVQTPYHTPDPGIRVWLAILTEHDYMTYRPAVLFSVNCSIRSRG